MTAVETQAIDLCMMCVRAVIDNRYPTTVEGGHMHGMTRNTVNTSDARDIMEGRVWFRGVDGVALFMVAVTTIQGTRVCAYHAGEDFYITHLKSQIR